MDRREFCAGAIGASVLLLLGGGVRATASGAELLRPPGGYDQQAFLGACIRCDRCRSACPQGCIALGTLEQGWLNVDTPIMNFTRGFCDFCENDPAGPRCVRVCAAGALGAASETSTMVAAGKTAASNAAYCIGCAVVDTELCVHCQKCLPVCAYGAIAWDDGTQLPLVNQTACNGCGACEFACPSDSFGYYGGASHRAIYVVPEGGNR